MKSTQFDRLLASTALALVLALSSQAGMAQQTEKPVEASVPMPDTLAAAAADGQRYRGARQTDRASQSHPE